MNLVKNPGLELPIFGPEEVVSRDDMRAIAINGLAVHGLFVRPIDTTDFMQSMIEDEGLAAALAAADKELDRLGDACKAQVVTHQWGLAKVPPRDEDDTWLHRGELKANTGYQLVAEVELVHSVVTPDYHTWDDEILAGLFRYIHLNRPFRCTDLFTSQFKPGYTYTNPEPTNWLLDIDLIISKPLT